MKSELREVMASHPAVFVVGPRACGKTTTTRRHCRSILRLDVPAQAAVVRADPDAALRGLDEPVLVDEWQLVPEILGAVKRAVDDDARPGRFVLTGSPQADPAHRVGPRQAEGCGWPPHPAIPSTARTSARTANSPQTTLHHHLTTATTARPPPCSRPRSQPRANPPCEGPRPTNAGLQSPSQRNPDASGQSAVPCWLTTNPLVNRRTDGLVHPVGLH
jgi:hypothetical protein